MYSKVDGRGHGEITTDDNIIGLGAGAQVFEMIIGFDDPFLFFQMALHPSAECFEVPSDGAGSGSAISFV